MSRFVMNGVASEAVMDEPEKAPPPAKKAAAKKVAGAKPKD